MGDRIGAFVFDKGKADRGMRRPGIFTSDIGDLEKVKRMKKAAEVAAIPDPPVRKRKPVAPAVVHPPKELSMLEQLALAKFERAAAKLAHAEDPEPDTTLSMTELLRLARAKAGKT